MRPVLTLTGFLSVFLLRRLLRRGALRRPVIRWTLVGACLAAFVGLCVFGSITLRELVGDPQMLPALLRTAGVAIPLWVLALFAVVRIMFMKSGDLVELTYCFPLTNRARTLAFMLFETLLVGVGVVGILGALISGSLVIGGFDVLDDIVTCLVMPAVVSYLLASAYHLALERMLLRFRLARLRAFLMPVLLAATLIALFFVVTAQSERVLFAAVGGDDYFAAQLLFADITASYGLAVATASWLAVVAALIVLVCITAPRQFEPTRRFARVPLLPARSEFGAYLAAHLRAIETITVYGLALAGSYALFLYDIALPPILLAAVTVQAVYAYVSTEPLRACSPRRRGPLENYALLLGPPLAALALCAVPVGLLSVLRGIGWIDVLAVVGFAASNLVVLTLAGIAFPPEKGNPFSVVVGVVVASLVSGTLLLGTNLLGLPGWVNGAALTLISVAAMALSLIGLRKIERIQRHEVVVASLG